MLSETEGRAVLKECFDRAGIVVEEDFLFEEEGVRVSLDGFDPARRVGYEYITTADGRDELDATALARLEERIERGEVHLLLVDENDIPDAAALRFAATGFLDHLRAQGRGQR